MNELPAFPELTTRLQLRFADLNAAGHVANTAVPLLFDEARVRTIGVPLLPGAPVGAGLLAAAGAGYSTLVGQVTTEYVREIRFRRQDVEVRAWVSGLGRSRFALSAALFDDGEVAALSDCVAVLTDAASGRPVPLPDALASRLRELSGPPVRLRDRLTTLD